MRSALRHEGATVLAIGQKRTTEWTAFRASSFGTQLPPLSILTGLFLVLSLLLACFVLVRWCGVLWHLALPMSGVSKGRDRETASGDSCSSLQAHRAELLFLLSSFCLCATMRPDCACVPVRWNTHAQRDEFSGT